MGKKGSWLSAIKRVFTLHCKEKLSNVEEPKRKNVKEKKKKRIGKLKHGETNTFLPIFREPSSIEKILGEAERDHNLVLTPPTPPRPASPRAEPSRSDASRTTTSKPPSPRAVSPRRESILLVQHDSATKIQGAFRGYMARRSFKGLVRLQEVMRGYNVKRQTVNAMKYMQQLVNLQYRIKSHRIKRLENSPKSTQDIHFLWWNKKLPLISPTHSHDRTLRDYKLTHSRLSPSPLSQPRKRRNNNLDTSTPKSSRGTPRGRRGQDSSSPFDSSSFISCPPYPSYMAQTISTKAKVRPRSNPKERVMMSTSTTPVSNEKRRMSLPATQQQGRDDDMFRWNNKGSLLISNNISGSSSGSVVVLEKHKTVKSVGNLSFDSTVSRKPFNRFV